MKYLKLVFIALNALCVVAWSGRAIYLEAHATTFQDYNLWLSIIAYILLCGYGVIGTLVMGVGMFKVKMTLEQWDDDDEEDEAEQKAEAK